MDVVIPVSYWNGDVHVARAQLFLSLFRHLRQQVCGKRHKLVSNNYFCELLLVSVAKSSAFAVEFRALISLYFQYAKIELKFVFVRNYR